MRKKAVFLATATILFLLALGSTALALTSSHFGYLYFNIFNTAPASSDMSVSYLEATSAYHIGRASTLDILDIAANPPAEFQGISTAKAGLFDYNGVEIDSYWYVSPIDPPLVWGKHYIYSPNQTWAL